MGTVSGCSGQTVNRDTEKITATTQSSEEVIVGSNEILKDISVGWNLGNAFDSCVDGSNRNVDGFYLPVH